MFPRVNENIFIINMNTIYLEIQRVVIQSFESFKYGALYTLLFYPIYSLVVKLVNVKQISHYPIVNNPAIFMGNVKFSLRCFKEFNSFVFENKRPSYYD